MVVGATVVVVAASVVVTSVDEGCVDGATLSGTTVASTEASVCCSATTSLPLSMDALHALPANTRPASTMVSRWARMGFHGNDSEPVRGVMNGAARESFAVAEVRHFAVWTRHTAVRQRFVKNGS